MTQEELEQISKEAVQYTGAETPGVIAKMLASMLFDIRLWNRGEGSVTDMANSIAQCRVALEMAKHYYGISEEMIEGWIMQVLDK